MGSNAPREKAGFPLESIFAGVIAKPSDEPAYTEELNESSAVVLLFPRLFIG